MSAAASSPSAPALNVVLDSLIPADDPGRVPEPDEVYLVINDIRRKLADIHNRLEDIIYNTDLIMGSALPPERVAAIVLIERT